MATTHLWVLGFGLLAGGIGVALLYSRSSRRVLLFVGAIAAYGWAGWWNGNVEWLFYAAVALTASWLVYFGWALRDFKTPRFSVFSRRQVRTPPKEESSSSMGVIRSG